MRRENRHHRARAGLQSCHIVVLHEGFGRFTRRCRRCRQRPLQQAVILRRIGSLRLLIQLIGRSARLLKPHQEAAGLVKTDHLVLDYAETFANLGDMYFNPILEQEQYERAKKILSDNKDGHNQLAQQLIDKEVIFAEDVEAIFGKRPWASRSEEIISASKTSKELKEAEEQEAARAEEAEKEVK